MTNMRNANAGENLKDVMYSGLNVDDGFKRVYGKDLDKYADKYQNMGEDARKAKIRISDFNDELVKSGKEAITNTSLMQDFGSGLANVGKTALSIAGDVGLNVLISAGLTAAGKAWDNYSNKQENAIEKGNEALSNYKQTNSTMQEATSWIKDNAERYTELAKGATSLGEQGTLTDAEFKEYNELSAQMATYLPSQIKGYNSLGTAILSVGDSTKQVNKALQSEKLTQYAKSANEASDVIDKYIAEMYQDSGITKETGITNKQKAIEDFLKDYQNGSVKRAYENSTDYLHSNGSYGNGYSSIYGSNKDYMSTYMDNGNLKDAFKAAGIKGSGWFGGYTKEDYLNEDNINTLRNYQQQLSTEAQSSVNAIKEIMPAFLQSNKDYLKLADKIPEIDSMMSSIYSSFDQSGVESILGGSINDISSEEAEKGLRNWTNSLVKDLQKKDTQDALTSLFALDDKKTKMSFDEYEKQADDAVKKVRKQTDAFTDEQLKNSSGIHDTLDQLQTDVDNITSKFSGDKGFSEDKLKSDYTSSQLDALSSIATNKSFTGNWKTALEQMNSVERAAQLSADKMQKIVTTATSNLSTMQTAISESMSNTGVTADTLKSLASAASDNVEGYDFTKKNLFTESAKGIKVNKDALSQLLEVQHKAKSTDFSDAIDKQTKAIQDQNKAVEKAKNTESYDTEKTKLQDMFDDLAKIRQARSQYNALYQQQQEALTDYADWVNAQNTENAGDKYTNMVTCLKNAEKLYNKGLVGTDDFKSFAKMISPTGATDVANFEENYNKAKRYLTDNDKGVKNFLNDLKSKGLATYSDSEGWNIGDIDLKRDSRAMGIGKDFMSNMFGRLEDYGFHNNVFSTTEEGVQKLSEAYKNLFDSQSRVKDLEKNDSGNATAIQGAKDDVEAYKADIEQIKNGFSNVTEDTADQYSAEIDAAHDQAEFLEKQREEVLLDKDGKYGDKAKQIASMMEADIDELKSKYEDSLDDIDVKTEKQIKKEAKERKDAAEEATSSSSDSNSENSQNSTKSNSNKGSVDLAHRPTIKAQKLADMGYEGVGDPNSIATVFSSTYSNEKGDKSVLVTPILPNGDVLEPDSLSEYAQEILDTGEDTEGIGIRTFEGKDSIQQADAYAEALHKVHEAYYGTDEAAKESLNTLKDYSAEQLKSIQYGDGMYDANLGDAEKSVDSLMKQFQLMGMSEVDAQTAAEQFIQVMDDMGLLKVSPKVDNSSVENTKKDAEDAVDSLNNITGKKYKIDFDTTDPDKIQQQLNEISSEVDKHVTTDSEGNPHYDESQEGAVEAEKAYKAEVQHQQQNEYETSAMGQYESDNNLVQAMQNFMQAKNEMDTQTQYAQKGMNNTLQTATEDANKAYENLKQAAQESGNSSIDLSDIQTAEDSILALNNKDIKEKVDVDTSQAESDIQNLQNLDGSSITINADVSTNGGVEELENSLASIPQGVSTIVACNVEGESDVDNLESSMESIPDNTPVTIDCHVENQEQLDQINQKADQLNANGKQIKINATVGEVKTDGAVSSTPIDVKGNVTSVTGTPSGTVDVKGKVTSVTGNPSGTVNVKGNIKTGKVEKANGTVSNGTINYKKGKVEKADGTTSKGIINYKKGDVEKADGTVSTGVINYSLGSVATPKGMTATGVINYTLGSVAKPKASGTMISPAKASGTAYNVLNTQKISSAHADGKVGLKQNETALLNEVGTESIVRDGVWSLIPGGAHLANLKKGDIIFSASQTEALLKNGSISGHARAYASGTVNDIGDIDLSHAFAGGMHGNFAGGAAGNKLGSSSKSNSNSAPATQSYSNNTSAVDDNTSATKDNTKAAKHSSTVFEWVERSIKKFKNAVENISNKINDYVTSAFKTSLLKQQISALQQEINANKRGQKTYMDKANSIANGYTYYYTPEGSDTEQTMNIVIPDSYKQAVQGGYWNIEDMDTTSDFGKGLAEAIQKYQDYYDKATDCSQAVQELYNEQLKVFEQWANMPTEEAEKKLDKLTNKLNGIKSASTAVSTGGSGLQSLISQIKSDTGLGTAEKKLASAKKTQASAKKKASTANKNYATVTKEANSAKSTMTSRGKSVISIAKKSKVSTKKRKEIQNAVKKNKAINIKGLTGNTLKAAKQYNSSRSAYTQATTVQTNAKKSKDSANKAYSTANKNVRTQQANVNKITNSLTSAQRKVLNNKDAKYAYVPQNAMLDQQTAEAKQENAVRQAALKKANKNVESYEKHINSRNSKRNALLQNKKLTKAQKAALKANKNIDTSKITDKKLKAQIESYNKANKTVKSEATKYRILKDAQSKAQSAADQSQAEYAAMRVTNEQEKFKNIQSYYDDKSSLYKGYTESHQKKYEKSETHGNYASSKKYTTQITDLNKERTIQVESAKKLQAQLNSSVKKGIIKKGSLEWIQLTAQINEAKNAVSDLDNEIEQAKQDQITTLYEEMFDRAIEKANQLKDKIGTINDLITDDMMIDKDTGNLTEMGMLSIALNSNQLDTELGNIQTYVKKRQQIIDDFNNGKYGEKTYDELMSENDSAMQNAIQSANNYRNSILKIITSQAQAVQDALFKQIDAYKKALKKKKEYYDFDKQLKKKNSEIELLDQQIAALEGVTDAESKAMKAKLEAQRKEKQDDLNDTVRDHVYDLQVNGLDDLKDQLSEDFEKWSNQLSSDLKKMSDAISSAISNSGMDYDDMQKAISKILEQFGLNPNDYFTSKDNTSIKNSNRMDSGYNSGHLQGYAKGTKRVGGSPRVVMTNENGREIIVTKKGILTPVEPSDGIIPNDMTETLMQMAMNYRNFDIPEIKMPDVQIINKENSDDGGNVYVHYDTLLTVQGDVTKDALPDLKTILQKASEYTQNDIRKNRRRFG